MKTNEADIKRKKRISRRTVIKIDMISYLAFLAMNIFALAEGQFFGGLGSVILSVLFLIMQSISASLEKSPRIEPKDELYLQNAGKAGSVTFIFVIFSLFVIGVISEIFSGGIKITINSKICFIAISAICLITDLWLLIFDHGISNDNSDRCEE